MAHKITATPALVTELKREGILPDECVDIKIAITVDALIEVTYRVLLTNEQQAAFGRAFLRALGMNDSELVKMFEEVRTGREITLKD